MSFGQCQGLPYLNRIRSSVFSQLLQETQDFRDRVQSNGGTLEDGILENLIDPLIRELKNQGHYQDAVFLGAAGAREVVSGNVAMIFDASGGQNDVAQATSSKRPVDTIDSDYGNRVVANSDGSDDFLKGSAPETEKPYIIFAVGAMSDGDVLFAGKSNNAPNGSYIFNLNGGWGLFSGSAITGGTHDTSPHDFVAEYASTDKLFVDGAKKVSGNAGANDFTGTSLLANTTNNRNNSEAGAFWMLIDGTLTPSEQDVIRAITRDYYSL